MNIRHQINRLFISSLAAFTLIAFSSCSNSKKSDEDVLARVGQFDITKQHYLNELRRFYDRTGQAVNLGSDVMENVLNTRLNRYVIVEYAFDKGWDTEPQAQHMKAMIERKVNMEEFEKLFIHGEVEISENDLRELFYRANTSLRASHLFAPTRHEADSLFALLESGRSFESIAKEIFRDSELARSGGDLGYFTIDDMDISFEDQAYRMDIGDISRPVRTSQGYSIIKLTDVVTTPIVTETEFANKRNEVAMIARQQKLELATRQHLRQTIDSYNIDESLVKILWEAVQNNPEVYFTFNDETSKLALDVPSNVLNQPLTSIDGFTFTVDDFLRESHFSSVQQRSTVRDFYSFKEQVHGTVYRAHAISRVQSHSGYDAHLVKRTIEETFYNYLQRRFEDHLDALVEIPADMVRMEYMKNSEMYVEPIKLNLAEIIVTTEDRAEEVWNRLEAGDDFITLLNRYTADPAARQTNGELGFLPIDRFGMMAPALGSIQPGEYAGPFQVMSNRFLIFKCLDRIEARQLDFDEAKPIVERVLHASAKDELRFAKVTQAREKFNATIYTERLHAIPIQL